MPAFSDVHFGDDLVASVVVVTIAVCLLSTAALLAARGLRHRPAARHLVLFSALVCSLSAPLLVLLFRGLGVSLLSVPLPIEALRDGVGSPALVISRDASVAEVTMAEPAAETPRDASPVSQSSVPLNEPLDTAISVALPHRQPSIMHTESAPRSWLGIRLVRAIATSVLAVWLAGSLALAVGVMRSWLHLSALRKSAHAVSTRGLRTALEDVQQILGMRSLPAVLVSSKVHSPLAFGAGGATILLPAHCLRAITPAQLRDVLLHEMAHILRRDHVTVLLQAAAKVVFWPIILVHLVNRQLAAAREEVCDNYVLARRDAVSYGETLLRLAQLALGKTPPAAAVGMLCWRENLEERIRALTHHRRSTMTRTNRWAVCIVVGAFLLGCAALCSMWMVPATDARASEPGDGQAPPAAEDAAKEAAAKADQEVLQGTWEGQSGEREGEAALPEDEIKKMRLVVKDDLMLLLPGGEWTRMSFKLDTAKTPRVLLATPIEGPEKGKTTSMIYELDAEADTLKICGRPHDHKEGKKLPADFTTKRGSGLMLLQFKHELRGPAPAKERKAPPADEPAPAPKGRS